MQAVSPAYAVVMGNNAADAPGAAGSDPTNHNASANVSRTRAMRRD